MRIGLVAVAGLMVAAGAVAQQGGAKASQSAPGVVLVNGCPGALRAQHQPTGPTMWTVAQEDKGRDAQAQKVKGPGVHVEFDGTSAKVKTLELSVSYLTLGARVVPVEPGMDSKSAKESKKTFVLEQEAARRVDADLLVGPAATITRVHLVSATFADGNVWHASSEDVCSVAPALYMPVEAKK